MRKQIRSMIRKSLNMVRYFRERINGRVLLKTDIIISCQRVGNEQMDSCMICTDYFNNVSNLAKREKRIVIYSAGIGDQINFELDLLKLLGGGRRRAVCN